MICLVGGGAPSAPPAVDRNARIMVSRAAVLVYVPTKVSDQDLSIHLLSSPSPFYRKWLVRTSIDDGKPAATRPVGARTLDEVGRVGVVEVAQLDGAEPRHGGVGVGPLDYLIVAAGPGR
jgi:hypothetical protein